MPRNPYNRALLLVNLCGALFSLSALAQPTRGTTYHDPIFDVSLSIPSGWTPDAADLLADEARLLTFTSKVRCAYNRPCRLTFGARPYTISRTDDLLAWSRAYVESSTDSMDGVTIREVSTGAQTITAGTVGTWQFVHVPRSEVVWFLQANFTEAQAQALRINLVQIAASLRFGVQSPLTLNRLYGSPEKGQWSNILSRTLPSMYSESAYESSTARAVLAQLDSTWWSPVRKQASGSLWPVNCNSSAHTQGALYAADIACPTGTTIAAAKEGTVKTVDTVGDGPFGKYIRINSGGYYHYYAHLSSIKSYIQVNYQIARKGLVLGLSGATGNVQGAHLHFHVQDGSSYSTASPILLTGMYGFVVDEYPDTVAGCATMGR